MGEMQGHGQKGAPVKVATRVMLPRICQYFYDRTLKWHEIVTGTSCPSIRQTTTPGQLALGLRTIMAMRHIGRNAS